MESSVARVKHVTRSYDMLGSLVTLGFDKAWRAKLVEEAGGMRKARVLDMITGTGITATMLASAYRNYRITGFDFDENMLRIAKNRSRGVKNVDYILGGDDYSQLSDGSFDIVVCAFAMNDFNDPVNALNEMNRVLRSGGRLVLLDMNRVRSKLMREFLGFYYNVSVAPVVNARMQHDWHNYLDARKIALDKRNIVNVLRGMGFRVHKSPDLAKGLAFIVVASK